ncbi:hypothetical protein [Blastococcus sp. SYSU DS0973]
MHPHLQPPRPALPAVLLSLVYLAAIAVAVSAPGQHAVAGLVVLTGLTVRWVAHHRRSPAPAPAGAVVRTPAAAPARATAA